MSADKTVSLLSKLDKGAMPPAIPCKLLRFVKVQNLPGNDMTDNLKGGGDAPGQKWHITYLPALRHFEVHYVPPPGGKPQEVAYVHESQVAAWWPA